MTDCTNQRFLFDGTDVRGELVHLDGAYQQMTVAHNYPGPVKQLLGEMLAAVVLLSGTIKFQGRLILQIKSDGQIPLAMVEATNEGDVRGIARLDPEVEHYDMDFRQLVGKGTLAMTVDPLKGERYQSLVPLLGDSIAACIEAYFAQSEQLGTRLILTATEEKTAGMLLQQLPPQLVPDQKERDIQWEHLVVLGQSVRPHELLNLGAEDLLNRLYVEDVVRLVDKRAVRFACSCSAARTAQSIATLGSDQLEYLFKEEGEIQVDCEFCRTQYRFTPQSLVDLVRSDEPSH